VKNQPALPFAYFNKTFLIYFALLSAFFTACMIPLLL